MRTMYKYNVIRYYPHIRSDEFINIGIFVKSEDGKSKIEYLEDITQLKPIFNFFDIQPEQYNFYLEAFKAEEKYNFYFNYGHHLKLSKTYMLFSGKNIKEVAQDLFFDYIGIKLKKANKYHNLNQLTKNIYNSNYAKCMSIEFHQEYSFTITFQNKKIYNKIGNLKNELDTQEIIYYTFKNENYDKYNFLEIEGDIDSPDLQENIDRYLKPRKIEYLDYKTTNDINEFFKKIIENFRVLV